MCWNPHYLLPTGGGDSRSAGSVVCGWHCGLLWVHTILRKNDPTRTNHVQEIIIKLGHIYIFRNPPPSLVPDNQGWMWSHSIFYPGSFSAWFMYGNILYDMPFPMGYDGMDACPFCQQRRTKRIQEPSALLNIFKIHFSHYLPLYSFP